MGRLRYKSSSSGKLMARLNRELEKRVDLSPARRPWARVAGSAEEGRASDWERCLLRCEEGFGRPEITGSLLIPPPVWRRADLRGRGCRPPRGRRCKPRSRPPCLGFYDEGKFNSFFANVSLISSYLSSNISILIILICASLPDGSISIIFS